MGGSNKFLILTIILCISQFAVSAQPYVDVGLFKDTPDTLEVRLRPDSSFDELVSNVVFTIRWDTASGAHLGPVMQSYPESAYIPMQKSGGEQDSSGYRYQVFAGFGGSQMNNFGAGWSAYQEVVLMKIPVYQGCDSFKIMNDGWASDNNGDYFISLNGLNRTDSIYDSTAYMFKPSLAFASTQDDTICSGDTALLDAVGGQTYDWSTGDTSSSITVTPDSTSTYSVTVTDTSGCADDDSVHVTVLQTSTTTIDTSICNGEFFPVGSASAYTEGGTYYDTLTAANGCDSIIQTNITIDSLPSASAGLNDTICPGETAQLLATGDTTNNAYQWSNGDSSAAITIIPDSTTAYTVTVTDTNGCSITDTAAAIVRPTYQTTVDTSLCENESYPFAGQIYTQPGTYYDTLTASNSCDSVIITNITIDSLPSVDAGENDTICPGDTGVLNASGDVSINSYTWSNGDSNPDLVVSPDSTTQYALTVTDTNGCSAVDTAKVVVQTDFATTVDTSICEGDVYPFDGQVYTQPGTYHDTLIAFNGCDSVIVTNLSIDSLPPVHALVSPDTLCPGDTATLTVTGGDNYAWSTGDSSSSVEVQPSQTSSYMVTVTDSNGCFIMDTVTVTVSSTPAVQLNDVTTCQGASVTLDAGPDGVNYNWATGDTTQTIVADTAGQYAVIVTNNNGCTSTDTASVSYGSGLSVQLPATTVCPGDSVQLDAGFPNFDYTWNTGDTTQTIWVDTTGTYSVTVIDTSGAAGCTGSDTADVTLANIPVADAGPDKSICPGDTATLTASGGSNYVWSNGNTDSTIEVSPATSTTFSVTVTNTEGCSNSDSVTVDFLQTPQVNLQDATICPGSIYQFNAGSGQSYQWSTGDTTQTITVDTTGLYAVTVTNNGGCTDSDTASLTFGSNLTVNLNDQQICQNDTATLNAGIPGSDYNWSTGDSTQIIKVTSGGSYVVTVTDTTGCTGTDTAQVTVNAFPSIDAGADQTICPNDTAILNATGNTGSVTWNTGDTMTKINVIPSDTTTYFVTASDTDNGCTATDSVTVNTLSSAAVSAGPNDTICQGDTATLTAGAGSNYQWNTGDTTQSISVAPTNTSTYQLSAIDTNGCTATDSAMVLVEPLPAADAGSDTSICPGDTATLTATGGVGYQWSNAAGTATITVAPSSTSPYYVTVTDTNGCQAVDTTNVSIFNTPNMNIAGADSVYCENGDLDTLSGTPPGGSFSGPGMSGNVFDPTAAGTGQHDIVYSFTDGNGCTTHDTVTVEVDVCPGIETQASQQSVGAYPNPFVNKFYVELSGLQRGPVQFHLYNVAGQQVISQQKKVKQDHEVYQISVPGDLSAGIYFLKIRHSSNTFNLRMSHVE